MKNILYVLLCLIMAGSTKAQQAFSLEEAVAYSLENGLDIRDKQLDIERAQREIKSFLASGLPQVNGSLNYQYYAQIPITLVPPFGPETEVKDFEATDGSENPIAVPIRDAQGNFVFGPPQEFQFGLRQNLTAGAELRQLLFDGTFFIGLKASRIYKDLKARELVQTETDARVNVTKAYLTALITQRNIGILDSNLLNLQNTYNETKAIYEEGFVEKLDVDRLELSLRNLRTEQDNLVRQYEVARNLLKFQMGYPIEEDISLSDNLDQLMERMVSEDLLTRTQFDLRNRPEYQTLLVAEQLSEMNIKRFQIGYVPSLYASASHQRSFQGDRFNNGAWFPSTILGATLSVPIFDGFFKEANVQIAKIDLEKTRIQQQQFMRSATMEVYNARIQYFNAIESKSSQERSMALAQDIYDTTQIKYREGVGSSIELTQAEAELYRTQGNYINALYDLLIAQTDLQKALGEL